MDVRKQVLNNIKKDIEIKTSIYNMIGVLASDDFYKWMFDNWETIENNGLDEFGQIMDLYIHGENSGYSQ